MQAYGQVAWTTCSTLNVRMSVDKAWNKLTVTKGERFYLSL